MFEDCSGEDPYDRWNEGDAGYLGEVEGASPFDEYEGDEGVLEGVGASPLDEYEGDEGDLEGEGASPWGEYKGDEGVLLVPSVFMSVLAESPDLPER